MFLGVDERSLVGCKTLIWMEYHCRYGMKHGSSSTQDWGGIPVVLFLGDDVQLPPVCDSPVYVCNSKNQAALHGSIVWKSFNTAIQLVQIVRQLDTEIQFKSVLQSLRDYTTTPEQAQWLQQFQ